MREVNFSVPSANRASVGITTALYDRRALDCTSTLPLVNSLNHLAYLTTSSPRIREILTIDGGIERLVYLLKCGKSKEMMETWKWSLAFQCVVNVAVRGSDAKGADNRGSENIRTRVVEADIVPVVTTILDNYMQIVDKIRAKQEEMDRARGCKLGPSKRPLSNEDQARLATESRQERRRHAPPPIDITTPFPDAVPIIARPTENMFQQPSRNTPPPPPISHDAIPRHVDSEARQDPVARPRNPWLTVQGTGTPQSVSGSSQPNTPTTPLPLGRLPVLTTRYPTRRRSASAGYLLPVTSQQDLQLSGESDDGDNTPRRDENSVPAEPSDLGIEMELTPEPPVLGDTTLSSVMPDPDSTGGDEDTGIISITHRSINGSIVDPTAQAPEIALGMSPTDAPFTLGEVERMSPSMNSIPLPTDRAAPAGVLACIIPRDEDVIMALQLLAYVSKYCHLRTYFEESHLVPRLKVTRELESYEAGGKPYTGPNPVEDNDDEYCQPNDYNIFPLVEKFTVRHHSSDMNYWACVVMRNLCRKDKSRGDIRQCAYWKCGKWEEYARQFAKCRRCRQTKYCSKGCQKEAWIYHRHWCEPAKDARDGQLRSVRHHHAAAMANAMENAMEIDSLGEGVPRI
jgi:hypothetical protein